MINKPIAGQSQWKSCHIYEGGTVRCVGTKSDDRGDYSEWTKAERAVINKAAALIASKLGGFEGGDKTAIEVTLEAECVAKKEANIEPKEVI